MFWAKLSRDYNVIVGPDLDYPIMSAQQEENDWDVPSPLGEQQLSESAEEVQQSSESPAESAEAQEPAPPRIVRIRAGDLEFELQPGLALLCRPLKERPVLNLEPGSSEEEDDGESELLDSEEEAEEEAEAEGDLPLPNLTVDSDLRPERLVELSKLESRGQLREWAHQIKDPKDLVEMFLLSDKLELEQRLFRFLMAVHFVAGKTPDEICAAVGMPCDLNSDERRVIYVQLTERPTGPPPSEAQQAIKV